MYLNKLKTLPLLLSLCVVFQCYAVEENTVQLNFTGKIKEAPCQVGDASKDMTVNLGTHNSSEFKNVGDQSAKEPFSITLNCPSSAPSLATVMFSGGEGTPPGFPDLFQTYSSIHSTTGSPVGVGIALSDSVGNVVTPGKASQPVSLIVGENILNYSARYQATRIPVDVGDALAEVTFTINYQ